VGANKGVKNNGKDFGAVHVLTGTGRIIPKGVRNRDEDGL
jgi:hypothetical protein